MELAYYPGCTLKTSAVNLERTAGAILERFGHLMVELKDWNCCGVVSSLTSDDLMHHIAPLRNLIRAQEQGHTTVVTLCDMCMNTLKQTNLFVRERPDALETLNAFMDNEPDYEKGVEVKHLLEFIRDDVGFLGVKKAVTRPLKGLRLMPYYGCNLLRPREVAIDDAERPTVLADLASALGAEPVASPFAVECCGTYHTVTDPEVVAKRAQRITGYAVERGADALVLSCPLCRFNLDRRGKDAEKMFEGFTQLPVFYYTQLLALALRLDPDMCDFANHSVDPLSLLKAKGIVT